MHINPMKAAVERGELQIGTWVNLVRNDQPARTAE